jgi:hypothetical protein
MIKGVAKISDQAGPRMRTVQQRSLFELLNHIIRRRHPLLQFGILHTITIRLNLPPWRHVGFVGGPDAVME